MVRAVTPIPFVKARFFDRCGKPLTGGKIYTYEANTTTPKVTYKDPYGLTPNTNPIILDAAGEADIYLDGTYRIRITDRNDVLVNDVSKIGSWFSDNLQDTLDNISGAMDEALKPVLQNLDNAINAAAAAGAGANGWTDLLVTNADDKTLRDVSVEQVVSIAELANIAKTNGRTVIVKSYNAPNYALTKPFDGGGTFVYDSAKAAINDGVITLNGWVRASNAVINPYMGGCVCDGNTDDSANLQKVLDTNANVIDGLGLTCKVNSSITIKPNQTLKNITLIAGTPGMNIVLVNTASKLLTSKITGTGTINITERAIYPAADGVTDVVIDADISNLTVGVHAQPLTPTANITDSMIPARWNISGHIHDIVGKVGNSEGYGVLLSPAIACNVATRFTNIARHALYLSAGASHNNANITCTDCSFIPVQIYSTQTQRASEFNTIRGNFVGTKKSSAGLSASTAIVGNSHNNDVSTSINSTGCESAIYIEGEGTANVIYPRNNKIHDNAITGSYTTSVINTVNSENTRTVNNNIYASWSAAAIFTNVSGTANPTNSGYVDGNSIVGNGGTTNHGIANSSNAPVYVGINDVRNIAGGTFIDYSTAKMRTGNLRQASGSVVTPSISSNATGDAVVTLPFTPVNQRVVLTKTSNSSGNFNKANDAYAFISGNTLTIRAFNGDTVAQTFTYSWLVLSD